MAKRKTGGNSSEDWKARMVTLSWNKSDADYIKTWASEHPDVHLGDAVETIAYEGHKVSVKFSEYYSAWVLSVTFGERVSWLEKFSVIMYHREFSQLPAILYYLMDVLVANDDSRLIQGGLPIGDW